MKEEMSNQIKKKVNVFAIAAQKKKEEKQQ